MKTKYAQLACFSALALFFSSLAFPDSSSSQDDLEAKKRFELARSQMRSSENDKALENLLWILDGGTSATDAIWRNALSQLSRMQKDHSPSVVAFLYLRKVAQKAWEDDKSEESLAALFELNHYGRYEEENLKLFDGLDPLSPEKEIYRKRMFRVFWNHGRYEDFLGSIDPVERLEGQISTYQKIKMMSEKNRRYEPMIKQTIDSIHLTSGRSLEALLKTDRRSEALTFARMVLEFEDSQECRESLASSAAKAGFPKFMKEM